MKIANALGQHLAATRDVASCAYTRRYRQQILISGCFSRIQITAIARKWVGNNFAQMCGLCVRVLARGVEQRYRNRVDRDSSGGGLNLKGWGWFPKTRERGRVFSTGVVGGGEEAEGTYCSGVILLDRGFRSTICACMCFYVCVSSRLCLHTHMPDQLSHLVHRFSDFSCVRTRS